MTDVNNTPVEALLADMQALINKYHKVTRDIYRKKGAFPEKVWNKAFNTFGDFVKAAYEHNSNESAQQTNVEQETQEFVGNTWNISLPKTSIHTLEELLAHCHVDASIWEVERFIVNTWQMGAKINDQIEVTPLFQVKATLVKRQEIIDARKELDDLIKEAKNFISPVVYKPVTKSDKSSGNCLELLIPDLHAGKFAWSKETGWADYDTPTAIATYERAVDSILDKASGYVFDEIVLGLGNDLLNSDDYNSQTTKGTLVNSDTRYQKTYVAVRQMVIRTVEKLRHYAKRVIVKVVPGNHDAQSTFTLGDSLYCWFHAYPDVEIDNSPSPHKFYTWGKVLLGFTHGDKGRKADYGIWLATERPVDFGNSKFREVHIGHTHGLKVDEKFGVRVRTFAALCPPDAWHAAEHFVGNLRQAEAIVWNKEQGRIAEFVHRELD
jgi:hypothetical protein